MRRLSKAQFIAALMSTAAMLAGPALAAESPAPSADDAVANRLDEVTVTARRRGDFRHKSLF